MKKSIRSNAFSFISELYHLVSLRAKNHKRNLGIGCLIMSIDVDVGHRQLGIINKGKNDSNVHKHLSEWAIGQIEEWAFPVFIDLFNDFEIPVTFAMRGQLTELDDTILELFRRSTVNHDIGAHGFYHKTFATLTRESAEDELVRIESGMRKSGITPKSFVFPRNSVAHLELLEKYGYKCYRSLGGFAKDCMLISKEGSLFNVHPSLYVEQGSHHQILERILDISITQRLPFHMWFHLWSFGQNQHEIGESVDRIFRPLFRYAQKKVQEGNLTFETMLSATYRTKENLD
jgi:hypothetical protein